MKPTILVVDDTPLNIDVLKNLLQKHYTVRPAVSGELALRLAQMEPLPSLILLDIMMPVMDGYEVCKRLKQNPKTSDIPVIFITAESTSGSEVKGFELGAVDFISKPIVPSVVMARVNTHISLQQTRRELQETNLILAEEKELLEEIVDKMRSANPIDPRKLRYVQSSFDKMAGDILLAGWRPDGTQHLLIGDFSGHGLPAAMGGILAPYIFYRMTQKGADLTHILLEINRVLYQQLPTQLYMAACALEISADRKQLKLWNHGLPPAFYCTNTDIPRSLPSHGLPLGITEGMETFEQCIQIELQQGDCVYIYSDGINEAATPDQQQFGIERLKQLLHKIYLQQLPLETVWEELSSFCAGNSLNDDAILVEISA